MAAAGPSRDSRDAAGRRRQRLLAGRGRYVGDTKNSDHLEVTIVRSRIPHGRLRGVHAVDARGLPGVEAILTAADLDTVPVLPVRAVTTPGLEARRQPVIATDRVRYVGQPVAVVVATDRYVAEDAADLVRVDVDPLAPVVDAGRDHPSLWDPPLDNCYFAFATEQPAPDAGREIRCGRFTSQRLTAVPLETRGLVAEQRDGVLHLWGVTKYLTTVQRFVAGFFGLDVGEVVCHHVDVGGMFGVRGELYPEDFLVPWAARMTGRAVCWIEDRQEHFLAANHSRQQAHEFAVTVDDTNRLVSFEDDLVLDMGAYSGGIGTRLAGLTVESLPGPYLWQGYRINWRGMATTKTPVGVMRGPGTAEATFVRERALDIVARTIGADPIELRMRNLVPADDIPFTLALGPGLDDIVYDSGDYPATATAFFERVGLERLRHRVKERRGRGELVGIGAAFFVAHSGAGLEESVEVVLNTDGTFTVGTTANEVGQGLAAMVAAVATDRLRVPVESVDVLSGDSRAHDGGAGTYSSRTTIFVGSAIADASAALVRMAVEELARRWDVDAGGIERTDRGFAHGGDEAEWKELAPLRAIGRHRMDAPTYGFGIHLALAAVDRVTAHPAVERLWVGYDCGRVIDRVGAEEQLRGACIQALGGAVLEDLRFDDAGQPQATTLLDYLVPTASEAPPVEVHLFETAPAPANPLGVKGVGEAGMYGVAAAVANAVAAAVDLEGCGLTNLPITGDAVAPLVGDTPRGRPT